MIFPKVSELHLWFTHLDKAVSEEKNSMLLQADEIQRANRFRFAMHRRRFINARATLRSILSHYLNIIPQKIQISYSETGKPYLPGAELHFNLSHSHELALFAFTYQTTVGVDLEKIREDYNEDIAQRFFSAQEYEIFSKLLPQEKLIDFYRIWAGKEAVVKALGQGIGFSLASFTIPLEPKIKEIILPTAPISQIWYLENLDIFPGYQAAFATNQPIKEITYFEWAAEGIKNHSL